MKIISRSEWGAKPWRGQPHSTPLSSRTHYLVHYHGGPPPNSTGVWVPRNVEAIHLGNGWNGCGYNFLVDQDGRIYEGRGWGLVGAHCPGKNRTGIGVYVAVGGNQEPTDAAKRAVVWLYERACDKTNRRLTVGVHGDYYSTECAGPKLTPWVHAGMKLERGGGTQDVPWTPRPKPQKPKKGKRAPKFPLPRGHYFGPKSGPVSSVSGYYSHRRDLKRWQKRMKKRGWSITPDGLYGPRTAAVAESFQREKGLAVDGLIGAKTWAAAWTEPIT